MSISKPIRLIDIAHATGYSQTVVGKVLNGGSSSIRVSAEASALILSTAQRLHYHRNHLASALRKGRTRLIGILVDSHTGRRYTMLLQAIEHQCSLHGYRLFTSFSHDDPQAIWDNYQTLIGYGVEGVICLAHDYPLLDSHPILDSYSPDVPLIFTEPPQVSSLPYVSSSKEDAFTQIVGECLRQGKSRIALVHSNLRWQSERMLLHDYQCALAAHHQPFSPDLVYAYDPMKSSIRDISMHIVTDFLVPRRPDILLVESAEYALTIQSMLLERQWHLPQDLKIIGGNGDDFFQYATPAIPSLHPNYEQLATELLKGIWEPAKFISGQRVQAMFNTAELLS